MVSAPSTVNQIANQNGSITKALGSNDVKREDFLRLLIAQLQHQDPLNPVENQEFVAELATFSSLEQQQMQTKLLEELIAAQSNTATSQALSLIGKGASIPGNQFYFAPESGGIDFLFEAQGTGMTPVEITDASGKLVATDFVQVSKAGSATYHFDGRTATGDTLAPGNYKIKIGGSVDKNGNQTSFPTYIQGLVEGVTFENGQPVLLVNNQTVPLSYVKGVFQWEKS